MLVVRGAGVGAVQAVEQAVEQGVVQAVEQVAEEGVVEGVELEMDQVQLSQRREAQACPMASTWVKPMDRSFLQMRSAY